MTQPSTDATPLPSARTPVAIGPVATLAVLWALLLVGLGGVGIRDALASANLVSGRPWSQQALETWDARTAPAWIVPVAVVLLLVAVWLVYVALRPRARNETRLQAQTGVFLSATSLRRLGAAAARDVDGVDAATATASLRRISVTVTTTPDQVDAVKARVNDAVTTRLSGLAAPPRVRVRVRTEGGHP